MLEWHGRDDKYQSTASRLLVAQMMYAFLKQAQPDDAVENGGRGVRQERMKRKKIDLEIVAVFVRKALGTRGDLQMEKETVSGQLFHNDTPTKEGTTGRTHKKKAKNGMLGRRCA